MKLIGDEEINIAKGSNYQDLGCTATDNYNGDLTTKISIENNIDTSTLGNYTVTYTVKDSSGNTAKTTRTVNVVEKSSKNITNKKATGVPVLMYHNFYDKDAKETGKDKDYTEIHEFEKQLAYLTENNYYFPSMEELKKYIEGKSCLPEHSVVITIDDASESFFKYAVPIIENYNVKVTVFAITSKLDTSLMKQCSSKINFQSHTNDMHKTGKNGKGILLTEKEDKAIEDLKTSQDVLGSSTIFSYPFGDSNEASIDILKKAEFEMAFTKTYTRARPGDNLFSIGRIRISKGETIESFIKKVS